MSVAAGTSIVAAERWRHWLGSLVARVLGLVLLVAAFAKALDPALFALQLGDLVPLPAGPGFVVAVAIIAFEAGLGAALLAGWRHPATLVLTNATFLLFVAIVTWQLAGGGEPVGGCGCFGQLIERTPQQALLEDVGLLVLSGVAWLGRPAPDAPPHWRATAVAAIAAAGFAAASPWLPLDDRATALAPGVTVASTQLDQVVPELDTGRHLLVLLDRADPAGPDLVAQLNARLHLPGGPTPVIGIADDDPELAATFLWTAAPAFEVRSAPHRMLRRLHRTLPRSALIDDGRVVATWSGLPDDRALDALARGELP